MENITEEQKREVFDFLNDLRDSAVTNMFGAVPYIQEEFGFDRNTATELLKAWMYQPRNDDD